MGTLSGTHFSVPLRKLLPLRGRHVGMGQVVGIFRSVPLRDYFSLRAPSGPLMGTLSGTHVGTLQVPTFQK